MLRGWALSVRALDIDGRGNTLATGGHNPSRSRFDQAEQLDVFDNMTDLLKPQQPQQSSMRICTPPMTGLLWYLKHDPRGPPCTLPYANIST